MGESTYVSSDLPSGRTSVVALTVGRFQTTNLLTGIPKCQKRGKLAPWAFIALIPYGNLWGLKHAWWSIIRRGQKVLR